jgi:hypothetical protein
MADEMKNVKISKKHHDMIKSYCDEKGLKIYKVIQKWIDDNCKPKKKDIYGE